MANPTTQSAGSSAPAAPNANGASAPAGGSVGTAGAKAGTPATPGAGLVTPIAAAKPVARAAVGGTPVNVNAAAMAAAPAIKAPPFQISSVHEAQRYLKMFVYGNYGVGKTLLAGSAAIVPQMQDVLMIDAEAGDLTIHTDSNISEEEFHGHVDRVRVTTFKEFARVYEFLKLHCMYRDQGNMEKLKELESKLRSDYNPDAPARIYRTVLIDSMTELETFSMYQLLGITDRTALDEETAQAEWGEFKKNNTQILRSVRAYRDLPINLIITGAAAYVQTDSKKMIYQPALTGKLAKQIQGFMDIVGFLAMVSDGQGGDVRRMFVQPGSQYDAKCRFSQYKEKYFENPSVKSILAAVGLLEKGPSSPKK